MTLYVFCSDVGECRTLYKLMVGKSKIIRDRDFPLY